MRRLVLALMLSLPAVALAQDNAPAQPAPAQPAPTGTTESPDVKHDAGTVRTVDAQAGKLICDMPDGAVTYDISQAQLVDPSGKPAGVATAGLKAGDKVRVTYIVDMSCPHAPACRGALASEVKLLK